MGTIIMEKKIKKKVKRKRTTKSKPRKDVIEKLEKYLKKQKK